jgi:hypothetical protein
MTGISTEQLNLREAAVVASAWPAMRAACVDVIQALRADQCLRRCGGAGAFACQLLIRASTVGRRKRCPT